MITGIHQNEITKVHISLHASMLYLPLKREKINNFTIMISHSLEKSHQKVIYLSNFAISKLFFFFKYIYFKHVLTYSKGINNI